jgi:hypothetical protein
LPSFATKFSRHFKCHESAVSTTKLLLQKLRNEEWEPFLDTVKSFCEKNEIDVPDMNARYTRARGRSYRQDEESSRQWNIILELMYLLLQ